MNVHDLRPRWALLSAALLFVVSWSVVSCATKPSVHARVSYPAIGTVVRLGDGHVRATGVVGEYPVNGPGGTFVDWVLYTRLGSTTTSPAAIGSMFPSQSTNQTEPYAPYDGKLVTVEGTLSPPRDRHYVSSPWSHLAVTSISAAPPEVQARIPWKGSLVKPGRWFDVPWRHALALVYEELRKDPGYPNVAQASKVFGAPIPAPKSPLVGRLIGVELTTFDNGTRPTEWDQLYSTGVDISGPFHAAEGPGSIASILRSERTSSNSRTRSVRVHGQPGIITDAGTASNALWFWNGKGAILIGSLGVKTELSDADLLAIASSMTR